MKKLDRRAFLRGVLPATTVAALFRPLATNAHYAKNHDLPTTLTASFSNFSPLDRARRHPLVSSKPAVNFFEGALLGNGGLGAVITTRPDAVAIHLGHNNVWDIRISEKHKDEIGTFQQLFERIKRIPATQSNLEEDPWYKSYVDMAVENYRKPYPRPFPCGTLLLGFDRQQAELLGHRLDVATGICRVELRVDGKLTFLEVFMEMSEDRLWLRTIDQAGQSAPSLFDRVRLLPDPETPDNFPRPATTVQESQSLLSFLQVLPFSEPDVYDRKNGHPEDKAFRNTVKVNSSLTRQSRLNESGIYGEVGGLERGLDFGKPLIVCLELNEGLASSLLAANLPDLETTEVSIERASRSSQAVWAAFWERSGVMLEDELLERVWYHNLYYMNCSTRPGVTCPGLFANWNYRQIGTAWHGDYHMNYNTEQPFWVCFSSNHLENHLPYVDLVDRLLPISRRWAREYYGLRGAYFPHSAYPVKMNLMPYPVPTWGWEICETPWAVQSLWWHYLYSMDKRFLEQRAFGPIKEAALFLVDYMRRPEAHGRQWGDDKYHVYPTVAPELYGLTPGFKMNRDCLADLALIKFVFKAYLASCHILGRNLTEIDLINSIQDILNHFPDYPTADSSTGEAFASVPGEQTGTVYNAPTNLMSVFPGEDHGLHSPPEVFKIAANSYRQHRNEGGNDLVFLNLQGVRLGLLDLEKFKRQIEYSLLPNGTCTDMVMQVHGRYSDDTPYDFMARMGIWFENFALPVVINECLLQSYNGTLRFFPNWPEGKAAEFHTLRAVGAFLVSARFDGRQVRWIEICSEAGEQLKLLLPWPSGAYCTRKDGTETISGPLVDTRTSKGEILRLVPVTLNTEKHPRTDKE